MTGYERITEDEHAASASECLVCGCRARGLKDDGWICDGCVEDAPDSKEDGL